jgi:hypothetical protein
MSRVVPWSAGLVTSSVPPSASMRSLRPVNPDPVVADCHPHHGVVRVEFDVHDGGPRVLGRVGHRLGYRVIRRDPDLFGRPPPGAQIDLDRQRRLAAQRLECRSQSAADKTAGWMPRDLLQLLHHPS